ncbi:unnamed protein product [Trichogramma brassicae]|uniref:Metaxin glutathione S-transferase domain-containing protein n=1 Tax=Trichogramma brassicae TaxID=86971 RepID=A0A6H5I0M7_9HYME|nr:unnamed protein product [Trichogramma brassicae]
MSQSWLQSLEELNVAHNRLITLSERDFRGFPGLCWVDIIQSCVTLAWPISRSPWRFTTPRSTAWQTIARRRLHQRHRPRQRKRRLCRLCRRLSYWPPLQPPRVETSLSPLPSNDSIHKLSRRKKLNEESSINSTSECDLFLKIISFTRNVQKKWHADCHHNVDQANFNDQARLEAEAEAARVQQELSSFNTRFNVWLKAFQDRFQVILDSEHLLVSQLAKIIENSPADFKEVHGKTLESLRLGWQNMKLKVHQRVENQKQLLMQRWIRLNTIGGKLVIKPPHEFDPKNATLRDIWRAEVQHWQDAKQNLIDESMLMLDVDIIIVSETISTFVKTALVKLESVAQKGSQHFEVLKQLSQAILTKSRELGIKLDGSVSAEGSSSFLAKIKEIVASGADKAHGVVHSAGNGAQDATEIAAGTVQGVVSGLAEGLHGVIHSAAKGVEGAAHGVVGVAEGVVNGAAGGAANVVTGTISGVQSVAHGTAHGVKTVVGGALDVAGNVAVGVQGAVEGAVGGAAKIAGGAVSGAKTVVGGAVSGAANLAGKAITGATNAVSGAVEGASKIAGQAAAGAKTVVEGAVGGAAKVAGGVAGGVKTVVGGAVGGAAKIAGSAVTGAKTVVGGAINGAANIAGGVVSGVSGAVKGVGNLLGGIFGGASVKEVEHEEHHGQHHGQHHERPHGPPAKVEQQPELPVNKELLTDEEIYSKAQKCITLLSTRLGESNYFFGSNPTTFDVLVFSHLAPILKVPLPNCSLQNHLKACSNLVKFTNGILQKYFEDDYQEYEKSQSEKEMKTKVQKDDFPNKRRNQILAGIFAGTAMLGYAWSMGIVQDTFCINICWLKIFNAQTMT